MRQLPDFRLPPHSIEAEQSVLGGLMLEATAWDRIADRVTAADFYRMDHRIIFAAIAELANLGRPCDVVTVADRLRDLNSLEETGDLAYLGGLVRDTPTAANIQAYADIVRERSLLRQLMSAATSIVESTTDPSGRAAREVIDEAERLVFGIAESGARSRVGFQSIGSLLPGMTERLVTLSDSGASTTGLSTGFNSLDEQTSGLQPGELIIIAGRPSMGKTTLAVNIAENAALGSGKAVAIFSMEMSAESLALRMVSSIGRVNQGNLRTGRLTEDDWPRVDSAMNLLASARIYIDESPALTPTEVRARARRLKREKGLDLIVVDYLQLMQVAGPKENRTTEVSEISRGLKALAKELSVPVIALSQLNRGVEQRTEKRPVMSDLRECVTGDTEVWLADGGRVAIGQLVETTPEVWAMSSHGEIVRARCDLIWSQGLHLVFRLNLADGGILRATAGHRVFTERGWRELRAIFPGELVAVTPASAGLDHPVEGAPLSWVSVASIEVDGVEEVFDLTVPGPESWLANGIVTHNSGGLEQDADLILLIYREDVYDPNTTRKGIADIIIAKQRNGPIGDIQLSFLGQYTKFDNLASEGFGARAV